jgi:hypothetical protein
MIMVMIMVMLNFISGIHRPISFLNGYLWCLFVLGKFNNIMLSCNGSIYSTKNLINRKAGERIDSLKIKVGEWVEVTKLV